MEAPPGFAATAVTYFRDLQDRICAAFEKEDGAGHFEQTEWERGPDHRLKGGGRMRVMRAKVFEKVGVNVSHVWGVLSEQGMAQIPGAKESGGRFSATGISLVSHMANPHVPIVHMNLRCMETSRMWFGGGTDLTPALPYDQDTQEFHAALRAACAGYRPDAYDEYKAWCDKYFYLPHRREPRGVGGIFFDDLNSGDVEKDFAFLKAVGETFLKIYPPIVARRKATPFTADDMDTLLTKRGRYVEFNLVYDRGTKFGFQTDANPDAYLMSMPPLAQWK
ncbi:MAG: oxygen-dependent coproporphyrinogen oxidase [Rhodospirillaceae bacterium]|nr:oxygen-dependent coproporphyrinogen oxidase [Rhodospirillaceae bacterium]